MNNVKRNIVLAGMLAVLVPVQVDAGIWSNFTSKVWNPIKNNKLR